MRAGMQLLVPCFVATVFAVGSAQALEVEAGGEATNPGGKRAEQVNATIDIVGFDVVEGQLVADVLVSGEVQKKNGKKLRASFTDREMTAAVVNIIVLRDPDGDDEGEEDDCQLTSFRLEPLRFFPQKNVNVQVESAKVDLEDNETTEALGQIICDIADDEGISNEDLLAMEMTEIVALLEEYGQLETFVDLLNQLVIDEE